MDQLAAMDQNPMKEMSEQKRLDLIYKSVIAGSAFRLDASLTTIDQGTWDAWYAGFTATMYKDEWSFIQNFKILWEMSAQKSNTATLGVPADIDQLVSLIKCGRIDRKDIDYDGTGSTDGHPSTVNWGLIKGLTNDNYRQEADGALQPTPETLRKILDHIAGHISGNYYHNGCAGKLAGSELKIYFEASNKIIAAFRKFQYLATKLLPTDMVDPFKDGYYINFDALIAALKRRYGLSDDQFTIVDHFRQFDKIIAAKQPMEFKMGRLRTELRKMLFIDPEKFPVCQDFPGHKQIQSHPEEITPIVHTLLLYMIFVKRVENDRWEHLQKEYHNLLPGAVTSKKWHESRFELHTIMDREFKLRGHKTNNNFQRQTANENALYDDDDDDEEDDGPPTEEEIFAVRQMRRQQKQQRYRPPQRRSKARQAQKPTSKPQYQSNQPRNNRLRNKLKSLECRNCSKWAGTPKFHEGPFGGGIESKCPFDRYGRPRPGYKFLSKLGGEYISNIDVSDEELELEYESDDQNDQAHTEHMNSLCDQSNSFPF